jgi:D-hexose-6-phosphate mutarotase
MPGGYWVELTVTNDMASLLEALNTQFSLPGHLHFEAGENGLLKVKIDNGLATATVYLQGAHITAFQPKGEKPVLWMSPLAQFRPATAIRGGVPVIWPWFGAHPTDSSKPQHGFARTVEWQVYASQVLTDGSTQLQLQLNDTPDTRVLWPHAFKLRLTITVGAELKIELTSRNKGQQSFSVGGALHSYFAIGDVKHMSINGLLGREYIDKLDNNRRKTQSGELRIGQAVDRIYCDSADTCEINDAVWSRQINVSKTGSRSTVVWNPWKEKAESMADFSNDGYINMVCIEAANAADDVVHLAPGEAHTLTQTIAVADKKPESH